MRSPGSVQIKRQDKKPLTPGKDENSVVKNIKDIKGGFIYPKTASVMKVTITAAKIAATSN
jgi:hypothetical protein